MLIDSSSISYRKEDAAVDNQFTEIEIDHGWRASDM